MKRTTRLKIGAVLILIGFGLMIGTAGALETWAISMKQAIFQFVIGIVLTLFGGFWGGIFG